LNTLIARREKRKKKLKQSIIDHNIFTRAAPCERGHACASFYIVNDQIWPQGGVLTRLFNGTSVVHSLGRVEHAPIAF